jgi:PBSX family phage terminase large subunit
MQYYISDYSPHPGQIKLHKSNSKEILVISSIRAGKSYSLIHEAIVSAFNNETPYGLLISAPTYKLVEAVLERPIVSQLASLGLLKEHSFSRHESTLMNGNIIYYRSLEEPDNALRGLNIFKAIVDEASYCSKYSIDVVKGRLLTTNGQLILVGTPAGTVSWMYDDYIATPKENVEYIKFSIFDNPIITEDAVERLRQSYDPLLFKQEILGEWVNLFKQQIYYSFGEENISPAQKDNSQIYIGLDFNVDKNAWVAIQKNQNNTFKVIKEGYGARTTTDVAKQIISEYGQGVIVIPDATGGNKLQGVATTQFQLLRQAGLHNIIENRSNPLRSKRYAVVNAALLNALSQRRITIDPSCKILIKELRELSYKENTDKVDDKGATIGHISDAFGYALMYLTGSQVGQVINSTADYVKDFKQRAALANSLSF